MEKVDGETSSICDTRAHYPSNEVSREGDHPIL